MQRPKAKLRSHSGDSNYGSGQLKRIQDQNKCKSKNSQICTSLKNFLCWDTPQLVPPPTWSLCLQLSWHGGFSVLRRKNVVEELVFDQAQEWGNSDVEAKDPVLLSSDFQRTKRTC